MWPALRDEIAGIAAPGIAGDMPPGSAEDGARLAVDANRRFYDALWSASYVVPPQRFNTWPFLSALAASAPSPASPMNSVTLGPCPPM